MIVVKLETMLLPCPGPLARRFVRLAVLAAAGLALGATVPASARQSLAIPAPFEVSESPSGNYLAALVANAERDTAAAASFFREALRADPGNPELVERSFIAALANGNMPEGFGLAQRLTGRTADKGLANLALGVRAIKMKQYSSARSYLAKSGAGKARDLTATLLSAWTFAGGRESRKALETVDRLSENNVSQFRNFHAALIADLGGNAVEAESRMKAAYAADANSLRTVDGYARLLSKHGKPDEAKKVYDTFEKLLPRHPLVTAALKNLAAGKTLEPLAKSVEEGAAEVLYGLGSAGGRQGDELAALIYLRLSLYLQPDNALALITVADIYERLKQNEHAVDAYELVADTSPLRGTADVQTGLALDALGRTDDAVAHLQRLVDRSPSDLDALSSLANLQSGRKKFAEAEAVLNMAIGGIDKPDGGHWSLFYRRGIALERQKKWPQAEADFKKALELFPEQPQVLNYLGYSWIDMGMNLDEGFKLLRRAVELRPQDGYIVDSLGWAHFKLGHFDDAAIFLEKAADLKPSDPVINDHLGDAFWRSGRKLEAKFQWNHARDLKPEPDDLVRILKKIETGLDEEKPAEVGKDVPADTLKNGG